jgi:hypothetical protein
MFDDTPEVRWSNAWWSKILLGLAAPCTLLLLAAYCLATGTAYSVGFLRYGRVVILPVHGLQAFLMIGSYAALAASAFAYGYCRHHNVMALYYEWLLAVGLIAAAVCLIWCSILFFL